MGKSDTSAKIPHSKELSGISLFQHGFNLPRDIYVTANLYDLKKALFRKHRSGHRWMGAALVGVWALDRAQCIRPQCLSPPRPLPKRGAHATGPWEREDWHGHKQHVARYSSHRMRNIPIRPLLNICVYSYCIFSSVGIKSSKAN